MPRGTGFSVKNIGFGIQMTWIKPAILPFTTWSNYLISLDLSSLICKMAISKPPMRSCIYCILYRPGSLKAVIGSYYNR